MFDNMSTMEVIKLLAPLIAIQFCLMIFCLIKLMKDTVKFFPKIVWALIIIFINIFGPIIYLVIGREKQK